MTTQAVTVSGASLLFARVIYRATKPDAVSALEMDCSRVLS